jgi:hypothetical protein
MADIPSETRLRVSQLQDEEPPRVRLGARRAMLTGGSPATDQNTDDGLPLRTGMSEVDRARFRRAIVDCAASSNAHVVTPEILFAAAERAIGGECCRAEARVGLQPGTLNPVHDGHLMAAVAGALSEDLDLVLLACGGTVLGKERVPAHETRATMARLAVQQRQLRDWIRVTSIRQHAEDVFESDPFASLLAGEGPQARHANFDIAAFAWLFVANPNVLWTYLVGSDKVAAYGRKDERQLLTGTLSDSRVRSQVVYFDRPDADVVPTTDIEPYPWMADLWTRGVVRRSEMRTCSLSSSAIRQALSQGQTLVGGFELDDCVAEGVQFRMRRCSAP